MSICWNNHWTKGGRLFVPTVTVHYSHANISVRYDLPGDSYFTVIQRISSHKRTLLTSLEETMPLWAIVSSGTKSTIVWNLEKGVNAVQLNEFHQWVLGKRVLRGTGLAVGWWFQETFLHREDHFGEFSRSFNPDVCDIYCSFSFPTSEIVMYVCNVPLSLLFLCSFSLIAKNMPQNTLFFRRNYSHACGGTVYFGKETNERMAKYPSIRPPVAPIAKLTTSYPIYRPHHR